jgi:phosphatidate cytidylyltransferase
MRSTKGSVFLAALSDIFKRTKTGILLILFVVIVLRIDHVLLPLTLMAFIFFAMQEYFQIWRRKNVYLHAAAVLVPALAIPLLFFLGIPMIVPGALLCSLFIVLSVLRYPGAPKAPNFMSEIAAGAFGIFYIALLPSTLVLLRKYGFLAGFMPLVLTWAYDTFAYIVGSLFGRHKIAPRMSPKKSVEGTVAAFFLTFPVTFLLSRSWIKGFDLIDMVIVTLGIGIFGTFGDVLESGMKREAGLKDTSNVFPGHGGFLDRLDSLIFNIPFFYIYLTHYG